MTLFRNFIALSLFLLGNCVYISKTVEFEYYQDDSTKLVFEDFYNNPTLQSKFTKTDSIGLGYYTGNLWLKVRVQNPGQFIYLDNPTISDIKFYSISGDHTKATEKWNGRYIHEKYKDIAIRNPVFATDNNFGNTYFLKINSESNLNFKISLLDYNDILSETSFNQTTYGIFWGCGFVLLITLLINIFIKRQPFLIGMFLYSLLNLFFHYENWMILPGHSLSFFLKSSFFDIGVFPFIFLFGEIFSLEYLKKRNLRVYIGIFFLFILNLLLIWILDKKNYFLYSELQAIIISLSLILYIFFIYKKTNFLYSILLIFWVTFGLNHSFNLIKFSYQYNPSSTIPMGISFLVFEACLLIICIFFQDSEDNSQIFDPSEYVQSKIKENEDLKIRVNNISNYLTEDDKKVIVASSNLKIKTLMLYIKLESNEYDIEQKTKEIISLTLEYLNAYKDLHFLIQEHQSKNIILFVRNNNGIKFLKDIYKYIFYVSLSKEIKQLNIVSDERILYLQYDKEFEFHYFLEPEIHSLLSLSEFSFKKKLPVISFENYKLDKKDEVRKRFIGKFRYNFPLERRIWEYLFAERGNFDYLDLFNQAMLFIEKKDYQSAREFMIKSLELNPYDEIGLIYIEKLNHILEKEEHTQENIDELTTIF